MRGQNWINYPHNDFAGEIEDVHKAAAALDAWRLFMQPRLLSALHDAGVELSNGLCAYKLDSVSFNFPAETTAEVALQVVDGLLLPGSESQVRCFLRTSLFDTRAWINLPLQSFVTVDSRVALQVRFSIRRHWEVRLGQFSFGRKQEKHKQYETLLFKDPNLEPYFRKDGQEVMALEYRKGVPLAERREALFLALEEKSEAWQFSILEREVVRRLEGDPYRLET